MPAFLTISRQRLVSDVMNAANGSPTGGLAILAALPTRERQQVLRAVEHQAQDQWGVARTTLRSSIDDARRRSYAIIRNRVTTGVSAIGQHFCDSLGQAFAASSVAATSDRLTPLKIKSVAAVLASAINDIREELRRHSGVVTSRGVAKPG